MAWILDEVLQYMTAATTDVDGEYGICGLFDLLAEAALRWRGVGLLPSPLLPLCHERIEDLVPC